MYTIDKIRPPGITLISWLWIALGSLMILGEIASLISYVVLHQLGAKPLISTNDAPPYLALQAFIFQNFWLVLVLRIVIGGLAISAGVHFMRLHAWARTAIEALSWLLLVYVIAFAGYRLYLWGTLDQFISGSVRQFDSEGFRSLGVIIGTLLTLIFVVPVMIMIKYLKGLEVKRAIFRVTARDTHVMA